MVLTWTAYTGATYQLQYATSLTVPVWQDLGSPIVPTNPVISVDASIGPDPQRFYRIKFAP
jgi:hypothetical protein